jgi:PAS domain S-box-containing protein
MSSVSPSAPDPDKGQGDVLDLDFESFFAVSLDLMVIRDAAFRIVKVNAAWETVLGYRPEELEGQPMLSFIHPDDAPASQGQMHRVGEGADVHSFVNRYRRRDGTYRYFEWRARRQGALVYGVARDVTDRLAVEAETAAARAAAEAASRAKSEFLANMSHEIRTPLNGVIGVAGALAETGLASHQREMVELILTSGQTLERLVSDVLDLSRIEAGRMEFDLQPFDLRPHLGGVLDLFRTRAQAKGLAFGLAFGDGAEGWLTGDVVRIKQVLGNLVSNAIKFTAAGEVAITVELRPGADQDRDPDSVVLALEVRDTGIGFDADFARDMFQRFRQADSSITRRFGGAGLGLSICRALVETMGGEIGADAAPGEGARFFVSLPLRRCPPPEVPASSSRLADAGADRSGPVRVLLAEDHPVNQRVVQLILAPTGVVLTTVADGAEAVEACRTGAFDLILMDMQMPVMDGLAATRAIRELERGGGGARTPIVMLTANAMRHHEQEARDAGADLHLAKPVTPASLLGAMEQVLGPASDAL